MKSCWIKKEGNKNLILMFGGWACDEDMFKHIEFNGYDMLSFFDYSDDLTSVKIDDYNNYDKVTILAWSFGVWVADFLYSKNILPNISHAYALNGTLKPINDKYGIKEKSFMLTVKGLERVGLSKFYERICSDMPINVCKRDIKIQISELKNLQLLSTVSYGSTLKWDGALVGGRDTIFPAENIENFWIDRGVKVVINENIEHYPFCVKGVEIINNFLDESK